MAAKSAASPTRATAVWTTCLPSPAPTDDRRGGQQKANSEDRLARLEDRLARLEAVLQQKANAAGVPTKEDLQELKRETLLLHGCAPRGARLPAEPRRRQARPRRERRVRVPGRQRRLWGVRQREAPAGSGAPGREKRRQRGATAGMGAPPSLTAVTPLPLPSLASLPPVRVRQGERVSLARP